MNPIFQALSSGHSPQQILQFLSKAIPGISPMVAKATSAGYTAKQILGFLSKNFETEDRTGLSESARHAVNRRADAERTKFGLKLGATALGAPLAASMAQSALSRALPAGLGGPISAGPGGLPSANLPPNASGIPPSAGMQAPVPGQNIAAQQIGSSQPPIPPSPTGTASNIAQSQAPTQAIIPQRDINKSVDIIKNIGEEGRIRNLLEGRLPPKDVAGVLRRLISKDKLQALESVEGGLEAAIEDYAQSIVPQETKDLTEAIPTSEEMPPEIVTEPEVAQEDLNIPEETIEPPKPIQKNETVVSPHGIGQVKEIRNGRAIVEVDGKKHQVDEADLEKPEYSEDEIADAYDDLMAKIPEPERSSFISWAGYDEDRRVLGYIPRGGKYEELTDITPEEAELIKHGKGVARTTGENREGYHIMGGDTRGLISQIQHDRRKKRETESKKQLTLFEAPKPEKQDRGMKPIFDEMAFARGLSRERDRKKAEEARAKKKAEKESEKARIKREKDEAKKRKKQA